jgi:hypothetical protein
MLSSKSWMSQSGEAGSAVAGTDRRISAAGMF